LATTSAVLLASMALDAGQAAIGGRAATPAANRSAALCARGLELGYNLDYPDALAAFRLAISADPDDSRAYCLAAATEWTALLFEQGAVTVDDYLGQARADVARGAASPQLDRAFHEDLDRAQAIAEAQLRAHPADADAHFRVGSVYGFRASYIATVEGRVVGSLGSGRRAYREHQRALEIDPARKDAGLIVGLYRYTVASLPRPLRLMARIVGFDGDRARGLALVESAAHYPSDSQPNALFTLLVMYNRESRWDDALAVIADLQHRFPRNRLLWLEAGSTALRAGRPAIARTAFETGLAMLAGDTRPRAAGEVSRWHYGYGATLVALRDVAPAERELRAALPEAVRDWVRGRIHRELGKLADLGGDRARAKDEYRLADRLCRRDHDNDCADEAQALVAAPYR
jgi:tetratricopeptide (TPR) repeat protein